VTSPGNNTIVTVNSSGVQSLFTADGDLFGPFGLACTRGYLFSSFFPPVDNPPTVNVAKRAVPSRSGSALATIKGWAFWRRALRLPSRSPVTPQTYSAALRKQSRRAAVAFRTIRPRSNTPTSGRSPPRGAMACVTPHHGPAPGARSLRARASAAPG
jgi:hypothetical protein